MNLKNIEKESLLNYPAVRHKELELQELWLLIQKSSLWMSLLVY